MYSFPGLKSVCCSMSSSNCCFYTFIRRQVRWSGIPISFRIFHNLLWSTQVKGFGVVNKAEVDVFLELSCFFDDPVDVGNLISCSSAFSKSNLNIGISRLTYCWSLGWKIFFITLLACEMNTIVRQFEHYLALPFLGIEMKTDRFQFYGYCWVS